MLVVITVYFNFIVDYSYIRKVEDIDNKDNNLYNCFESDSLRSKAKQNSTSISKILNKAIQTVNSIV